MTPPKVSVVIPAYNQASYLPRAIQSVLDQSLTDWELIVVDDGSTDETSAAASCFAGPRIHMVRQENQGLPGARNTGIARATGEYLAFLDADDAFHPEKLKAQAAHLDQNPEIGLSYASRIEVDQEMQPVWFLRAPAKTSLKDLVLGFPFTINDLLVRRSWVEQAGAFDESFRLHSEDRDFYLRLGLAGCCFARLDRFVAYRRIHARRVFNRIPERIETMGRALETVFSDPRCPAEVLAARDLAYAKIYLTWALQEFVQEETALAQEHLRTAARLDPTLFDSDKDGVSRFLHQLAWFAVRDGGEHADLVERVLAVLPPDLAALLTAGPVAMRWALARGYLVRGLRSLLWGRAAEGSAHLDRAAELGGRLDQQLLTTLSDQLLCYEMEYGSEQAQQVLQAMAPTLKRVGSDAQLRWLGGFYSISQAFNQYRHGQYARVPASVLRAILRDPSHLADRGVISILARSLVGMARSS